MQKRHPNLQEAAQANPHASSFSNLLNLRAERLKDLHYKHNSPVCFWKPAGSPVEFSKTQKDSSNLSKSARRTECRLLHESILEWWRTRGLSLDLRSSSGWSEGSADEHQRNRLQNGFYSVKESFSFHLQIIKLLLLGLMNNVNPHTTGGSIPSSHWFTICQ